MPRFFFWNEPKSKMAKSSPTDNIFYCTKNKGRRFSVDGGKVILIFSEKTKNFAKFATATF